LLAIDLKPAIASQQTTRNRNPKDERKAEDSSPIDPRRFAQIDLQH
jgi:hypothetical protein